jgi:hypothetical protein
MPRGMAEGRPGRGQVRWCPVVGWEGEAAGADRAARRERALFAEVTNSGQPSDGLMLVYLVALDGGETDEQSVDPGASGHASPGDLKRLASAVAPKHLIPIHTFEREKFPSLFHNVILVDDEQWIDV